MKKLVAFLSIFALLFTCLTCLNHELEKLESKLANINIQNKKLENDLSFIKSEWSYLNSPKNISLLVSQYFDHKAASLIEMQDFLHILIDKGNDKNEY